MRRSRCFFDARGGEGFDVGDVNGSQSSGVFAGKVLDGGFGLGGRFFRGKWDRGSGGGLGLVFEMLWGLECLGLFDGLWENVTNFDGKLDVFEM